MATKKKKGKAAGWGAGRLRRKRRTRYGLLSNREYTALDTYNEALGKGSSPTVAMLKTHGYKRKRS